MKHEWQPSPACNWVSQYGWELDTTAELLHSPWLQMMSAPQDDSTIQDILALFSTNFEVLHDRKFWNCHWTAFSKKKKNDLIVLYFRTSQWPSTYETCYFNRVKPETLLQWPVGIEHMHLCNPSCCHVSLVLNGKKSEFVFVVQVVVQ